MFGKPSLVIAHSNIAVFQRSKSVTKLLSSLLSRSPSLHTPTIHSSTRYEAEALSLWRASLGCPLCLSSAWTGMVTLKYSLLQVQSPTSLNPLQNLSFAAKSAGDIFPLRKLSNVCNCDFVYRNNSSRLIKRQTPIKACVRIHSSYLKKKMYTYKFSLGYMRHASENWTNKPLNIIIWADLRTIVNKSI